MEKINQEVTLHPHYLEALFAHKSQVSSIFRDIIGLHEIHHFSLNRIDSRGNLLSFSSTPAMEFNLFNSRLWQFDGSYQPDWFRRATQSSWEKLYDTARFDEIYYLKQIKHALQTTRALAAHFGDDTFVFSLASRYASPEVKELFASRTDEFYKIGQYCMNSLLPLFEQLDASFATTTMESSL